MEDDEDLEFLRLAALKSINAKKEIQPKSSTNTYFAKHPPQKVGNAIQVVENVCGAALLQTPIILQPQINRPFNGTYSPPPSTIHPTVSNRQQIQRNNFTNGPPPPPITTPRENNEPYVPQRMDSNGKWIDSAVNDFAPYVPAKIGPSGLNNVQLSPRSAAFVSQNNDILMRRKGGHSPNGSRSPPSPQYRSSPGRWSISPTPKFTAIRSSPGWDSRRSKSRSPINRDRSPMNRDRSPVFRRSPARYHKMSRSPPPSQIGRRLHTSRSPPPPLQQSKRMISRSPQRDRFTSPVFRRTISRSPQPNGPPRNTARLPSRSPPPYNRRISPQPNNRGSGPSLNSHKNWRGYSPTKRSYSPGNQSSNNWNNQRKSPINNASPLSTSPSYRPNVRRRTRSPKDVPAATNRADSRSPQRKYSKLTSSRDRPSTTNNQQGGGKRRSPVHGRKYGSRNNAPTSSTNRHANNRPRGPKRTSPVRRKTPPKSPLLATAVKASSTITTNMEQMHLEKKENPIPIEPELSKKTLEPKIEESSIPDSPDSTTPVNAKIPCITAKTEQEIEDELLASTDDEAQSDKDDEDEIDLFASEESESENEGRFKSSSSKNERATTASTVSFTKLGSASASMVNDLNDIVRADKTFGSGSSSSNANGRRERDDRYNRGVGGRNSNYSSRNNRDDRFRNRNNSSNRNLSNYNK